MWHPNGGELFYRTDDRMMTVDVTTAPNFSTGRPRLLFQGSYVTALGTILGQPQYDVTPDGRRFLMLTRREEELAARQIMFVQNWFEELRRLAPVN